MNNNYHDIPRHSPPPMSRAETIGLFIALAACTGFWLWLATQIQMGR